MADPTQSREFGGGVKTVTFTGKNFENWKYSVNIILNHHHLVPIVDGTKTKPTEVRDNTTQGVTNQAEIDKWISDDNLATHYLFNTISEDQQNNILTCTSAHSIWSSLTSRFQQNTVEKRQSIQQEFYKYSFKPEHTIRAHIESIKLLVKQLKDCGGHGDDEETINKIITSLPPSYDHFATSWESTPVAERTLDNLTTRLDRQEMRLKRSNGGERTNDDKAFFGLKTDSAALFIAPAQPHNAPGSSHATSSTKGESRVTPYSRGRGAGQSNRSDRSENSSGRSRNLNRCNFCNIIGHQERDCYYKEKGGVRCTFCHLYGHIEKDCNRKQREANTSSTNQSSFSSTKDKAYAAGFASVTHSPDDFFLDSGATNHMTDQRWMFCNFTAFVPGTRWISGIGLVQIEVLGKGTIDILTSVNGSRKRRVMHDVLYAPSVGISLFSVRAITEKGAEVHFIGDQAFIVRDGVLETTATRSGESLYLLDMKIIKDNVTAMARPFQSSLEEWHQRLAHINYRTILKMAKSGSVKGLTFPPGTNPPTLRCHECATGKMTRRIFQLSITPKSVRIGALIHSDVCGPMQIASMGGARYYVLFSDDCSGFRHVCFIGLKSEVPNCFKNFVSLLHAQTGQLVAVLRSDNGGEYESSDFRSWLAKKGIRHETSVRYTPQQNGISERDNRTVMEGARTILYSNKSLPLTLWAEAVNCVIYTLNRALSNSCGDITPYEAWYGRQPDLSNLRIFGSEFYVLVPKELRQKLDRRGILCIFVGNSDTQKGDRYWDPITGKINVSRDVSPVTHQYEPRSTQLDNQKGVEVFPAHLFIPFPTITTTTVTGEPMDNQMDLEQEEPRNQNEEEEEVLPFAEEIEEEPGSPQIDFHGWIPEENRTEAPRRSLRIHLQNQTRQPNVPQTSVRAERSKVFTCSTAASALSQSVPNQYQDAMARDRASAWKIAIHKEYDSLMKNNTWKLVELPKGASILGSRWMFKLKPTFDESEYMEKARFVVKGFLQVAGVDYHENEVYAPVLKHDSLRVLLSIAASLDLELHQLDVKTAFLYGELSETLYVQQPEGFIRRGEEKLVCRLLKPLYGLKQAPRKWNEKFNSFLTRFGLTRSTVDPCIYLYTGNNPDDYIILGIWVDDGLIATKSRARALQVIDYLEKQFEMTSGPADRFIGIEITRDRPKRQLFITQSSYIQTLLERFRMTECNPCRIPADPNSRLISSETPKEGNPNSTPYRALVGGLMYAMSMTRPDIAYAVIAVSRHSQNPGKPHWKAAKMILAYLAGTPNHGVRFSGTGNLNHLVSFSDADLAGDKSRQSTTGMLCLLNGGPVAWKSKLQRPVAQSTAEAEYYAAGRACMEIVWLRELLNQLGWRQSQSSPLLCDNRSAVMMVYNPVFHESTKHIEIKYHYIRQQVENGKVSVISVPGTDQLADFLTKPLPGPAFELNRSRIGVLDRNYNN